MGFGNEGIVGLVHGNMYEVVLNLESNSNLLGQVVQSWVKLTQGLCEIWRFQIWKLSKKIHFLFFCPQFDD